MHLYIPVESPTVNHAVKILYMEGALLLIGNFFYEIKSTKFYEINGVDYVELTMKPLPTDVVTKKPR